MWGMLNDNKSAVAFLLFLLGQIVLALLWGAHIDQKVTELAARIEILDAVGGRQVNATLARVTNLERSLDKIGETLTKMPVIDERISVLREQVVELNQQTKAVYKLQSENSTPVDIDNLPEKLRAPLQKLQKELDEDAK
jgi:cell shape-determining protein MreC